MMILRELLTTAVFGIMTLGAVIGTDKAIEASNENIAEPTYWCGVKKAKTKVCTYADRQSCLTNHSLCFQVEVL